MHALCQSTIGIVAMKIPDNESVRQAIGNPMPLLKNQTESLLGEAVVTIGYPLGDNALKLTSESTLDLRQMILHTKRADINPGNSGGPLVLNHAEKLLVSMP